MRRITNLLVIACLLLVSSSIEGFASTLKQKHTGAHKATVELPGGSWSFSSHPYLGKDWNTRPVVVVSVMTDAADGLTVHAVGIMNRSNKAVTAVKFRWLVTEAGKGLIRNDESAFISTEGVLPANSPQANLQVSLFTFLDLAKTLTESGKLTGAFRGDLAVSAVRFDDGTVWTDTDGDTTKVSVFRPVSTRTLAALTITPLMPAAACANQGCKYLPDPPLPGYTCEDGASNQFCTNCGTSCCNTICGHQPACGCN
jgi:hypothetical protein